MDFTKAPDVFLKALQAINEVIQTNSELYFTDTKVFKEDPNQDLYRFLQKICTLLNNLYEYLKNFQSVMENKGIWNLFITTSKDLTYILSLPSKDDLIFCYKNIMKYYPSFSLWKDVEITLRKLLRNDSWSAVESELMFTSKSMDQYQKEFDDFYNKFEPSYNDVKEYIQQKEYMKKLDPCMLSGFLFNL